LSRPFHFASHGHGQSGEDRTEGNGGNEEDGGEVALFLRSLLSSFFACGSVADSVSGSRSERETLALYSIPPSVLFARPPLPHRLAPCIVELEPLLVVVLREIRQLDHRLGEIFVERDVAVGVVFLGEGVPAD
jgi:hypothetical protein